MNVNLAVLAEQGFSCEIKRGILSVFPSEGVPSKELVQAINEVGGIMGFNEKETDDLFSAAHSIQVMSAIRKASNW